ncbi:MAG: T9SS type A sorting domain-containing protein [Saprospiraceae bacterium]|nr:T9SS type A sorting domain-containing protein [Saprospiraceae bacterium]MCB9310826.1 T9SS type A sorting domain-containing protein [Lewinellaceae bacterium]
MKTSFTTVVKVPFVFTFLILTFSAFSQVWQYGKNRYTIKVDGIEREFFVHIPQKYTGNEKVPLVFMLHGTSGDGEKFYDAVGWRTLSNQEGFIAVFPSSLKYTIVTGGDTTNITKWNTTPDTEFKILPPGAGADDIKFLREIVTQIVDKLNIDEDRIYLEGFSNGGQMAAKCAIEMSDVLAAVCENASSFYLDTTYLPKRKLPVLFQIGDRDYGPGNEGPAAPMSYFDELISDPNITYKGGKLHFIAKRHIENFDLQSDFTMVGDTTFALAATFLPNHPGPGTGYEFIYVFVYDLAHKYPNGENHPFNAPRLHWDWMKQFKREFVSATHEDKNILPSLTVNPNPSTDFIEIENASNVTIFDLFGTTQYSGTSNSPIDISLWKNGLYLVRSDSGVGKFIKI